MKNFNLIASKNKPRTVSTIFLNVNPTLSRKYITVEKIEERFDMSVRNGYQIPEHEYRDHLS
ncbi:hypothetical protein [uncultured Pedobacter sp.]|uniref:hypothetical protein n=1 Tax=uncultured Pedobacter sp. TaxID=246139 RepID=UPI0025E27692|nr:hypothetical protein [uncultured Pedobacter sp.]